MRQFICAAVLAALFILCLCGAETHNITQPKDKCSRNQKATSILDLATDFMNQAKNLFPGCIDEELDCGKKEKSLALLDFVSSLISQVKANFSTCPDPGYPEQKKTPMDCSEVLQNGKNKSGVYTIWPRSRITSSKSVDVYCDMDTDGGGWTVIQRRGNFSTPKNYFYKDWESYKIGFGDLNEEFWIGNDHIYAISNQGNITIRFDLVDAEGVTGYAYYDNFWIEDEKSNYTLHISGYNGTVGDGMSYNNNMKFSTKDRDNDFWDKHCAVEDQGAWWYNKCSGVNLNGLYQPGVDSDKGVHWNRWRKRVGLSSSEIKLRPRRI